MWASSEGRPLSSLHRKHLNRSDPSSRPGAPSFAVSSRSVGSKPSTQPRSLPFPNHPTITINQTTLTLLPQKIVATLAVLTSLIPIPAPAQQPPTPRTIILLDPAHGGPDPGARLPNNLLEKDITLAFAARLRALLSANGYGVISTHEIDPAVPFSADQRAEIGNHAHPTACLILHATSSGTGIHIVTSALAPDTLEDPHAPIPWNTAQSPSIPQSLDLANEIGLALDRAKLPVILSRASLRPLDNLTCPAVAIEIAPLNPAGSDATPVNSPAYQQNIAKAIAAAVASWRSRALLAAGAQK
jgi:N-acetylmuramoyl-L-alanine amidase